MGQEPGGFIYLLKPVENQYWYLLSGGLTIGFGWVVLSLLHRAKGFPRLHPLTVCVLALLACQIVSALNSSAPEFTMKGLLLPLVFYFSFLFTILLRPGSITTDKTFFLLLIGAAFISLYAIAQNQGYEILPYSRTVAGTEEEVTGKQLIASTFGHPNYMASYLAPLLFWAIYFVLAKPTRLLRFTAAVCGFCIIAALVVGGTRGPWLAVVLTGIPYYLILTLSPAYRRPLLFTAGLAMFVALVLLLVPNPLVHVQFDIQKRLMGSKEIAARFYYWLMAIEMLKTHPLIGVGYANFDILFWDYVDAFQRQPQSEYFRYVLQESIRGVRPGYVHNDHLQILTETGILGGVAWLSIWSTVLYQGFRSARLLFRRQRDLLLAATLLASLICFGVDGLTNFPLHVPVSGLLFWVSAGFWTALYHRTCCAARVGSSLPSVTT